MRERPRSGGTTTRPRRSAPPAPASSPPSALRDYGNAFVGRAQDLAAIAAAFARGARVVTVTGPAGMGKTRVASEFAARERADAKPPAPAVCFCDLTEVHDAEGLCAAMAAALGVSLAASGTAAERVARLGAALAERGSHSGGLLVLLDNFEQLVASAAETVARLSELAPGARFLVTSRERLRISPECAHELAPLALPATDAEGAAERAPDDAADNAAPSEAVALLLDRARRARDDYAPATSDEARAIEQIARELDGIPLALELAAARVTALGAAAVRDRLASRFDLLTHGARDARSRQRTLRGAIDWSWDLLADAERAAFAQCAVFRGGFTLEAAEAVLALPPPPERGSDAPASVLDAVQSLRDKSLLHRAATRDVAGGVPRFGLYESLREYAAERLAADPLVVAATARRHAEYYLRVASGWAEGTLARGGAAALAQLIRERDNLFAVAERALASAPPELDAAAVERALAALTYLVPVVFARGPVDPHLALLDRALAAGADLPVDPLWIARACSLRGDLLRRRGRGAEGLLDQQAAVAAARALGAREHEGRMASRLGALHYQQGNLDAAREAWEQAVAIHRAVGDRSWEGISLANLGLALRGLGDRARAGECYAQALAIHREVGNESQEALVLGYLGLLELEQRRFAPARECLERALRLCRATGAAFQEVGARVQLAMLAHAEGRLEAAAEDYARAIDRARAQGDRRFEGGAMGYLGALELEQVLAARGAAAAATAPEPSAAQSAEDAAALGAARARLASAVEVLAEIGDRRYQALFLMFVAAGALAAGAPDDARAAVARAAALGPAAPEDVLAPAMDALRALATGDDARAREPVAAFARAADEASSLEGQMLARVVARLAAPSRATAPALAGPPSSRDRAPSPSPRAEALVVHAQGEWFRLGANGALVSNRTRHVFRRLLARLVQQRVDAPGTPVPARELIEVGWPDERILPEAASLRLRVTLARLRDAGLRAVLLSADQGYLLDPDVPVELSNEPASPVIRRTKM